MMMYEKKSNEKAYLPDGEANLITEDRTSDSIYRTVKAKYMRWLQDQYDILLRRGDIPFRLNSTLTPRQQFVKYYQINNICIARETDTKLVFRI